MQGQIRTIAVVLAGGRGSRMNADIPKQYMLIDDKPVLYYSLKQFQDSDISEIVLVAGENEMTYCKNEIVDKYGFTKVTAIVKGGQERFNSVYNALMAVADKMLQENASNTYMLIHDGARPCIDKEVIDRTLSEAQLYGASTAAVPAKDTIKIADKDGFAIDTPDRSRLWQIQTPQTFRYDIIRSAYSQMFKDTNRGNITDDAMIVERYTDKKVKMSMGSYRNIKITTPEDMRIAQLFIKK